MDWSSVYYMVLWWVVLLLLPYTAGVTCHTSLL